MSERRKEFLTSQRDADGVWHAIYPTATLTLCGKPAGEPAVGRKWPPTCGRCSKTARRFHRIDGSMPAHWLPDTAQAA